VGSTRFLPSYSILLTVSFARPFHYNIIDPENDMLKPAIAGTRNCLEAAAKEKSVKHLVLTSSYAAILDLDAPNDSPEKVYTELDWNPATYEEAAKDRSKTPQYVYCKPLTLPLYVMMMIRIDLSAFN
jgi:hypothetical protein